MLLNLTIAAVTFTLAHRAIAGSSLRGAIVLRISERGFKAAFSVLSVILTTWLTWAYIAARPLEPIARTSPQTPIAHVLALVACYLIIAGLTTRNPTITGLGETVRRTDAVHGIIRLTRHPFLIGVAMLSGAHLLVLRTIADWLFFGTLALVALMGIPSIDDKRRRTLGQDWEAFFRDTSVLPGAAILKGRQRLNLHDIGLLRPTLGVILFALAKLLH